MSRFSDLDLDFTLNPISKDVNILRDNEAIKRSVRNIVLYNFLEKPFKPTFGGNVTAQLFENVNYYLLCRFGLLLQNVMSHFSLFENRQSTISQCVAMQHNVSL